MVDFDFFTMGGSSGGGGSFGWGGYLREGCCLNAPGFSQNILIQIDVEEDSIYTVVNRLL